MTVTTCVPLEDSSAGGRVGLLRGEVEEARLVCASAATALALACRDPRTSLAALEKAAQAALAEASRLAGVAHLLSAEHA